MKTHRKYRIARLATAAIVLASVSLIPARSGAAQHRPGQTQSATRASDRPQTDMSGVDLKLQVASEDARKRGVDHLTGNQVRGADGKRVGTVKDFIVEPASGKIVFAVVSSGGFVGIGDTLRLVPFQAINPADDNESFTTMVQQSNWNKLPAIAERDFDDGIITITEDQRRQLGEAWFGHMEGSPERTAAQRSTTATDRETPGAFGQRLVRVADIQGKPLYTGGQEIGGIDDVVIDFNQGTAIALVEVDDADLTGPERAYLVPFRQLQISDRHQEMIRTQLTRADFQRAEPARETVTATRTTPPDMRTSTTRGAEQPQSVQEQRRVDADTRAAERTRAPASDVTATGRLEQRAGVDPTLQSAARSIRQIWDAHPNLAKLNLQVTAEDGRLVLRGNVPNVEMWERAKDTAEGVIRGIDIQNLIRIDSPPKR